MSRTGVGGSCAALASQVTDLVAIMPDETLTRVLEALDDPAVRLSVVSSAFSRQANRDAFDALWQKAERDFGPAGARVLAAMLWTARETSARSVTPRVEVVWTGPTIGAEAIFRTEQTLLGLLRHARSSVIVVTYVAYRAAAVRAALAEAVGRGVRVRLVVESSRKDGGAASFDPRLALGVLDDPRFECFAWPRHKRLTTEAGEIGALHAKCVAVDDEVLFVSSANMTESALERNIELGLVVRGGHAARHVREHVERLIDAGVLVHQVCE
jgi:cardiolipin synthase A/B